MKDKLIEKLTKLLDVKSIVTIISSIVFAILALTHVLTSEQFLNIFMMIIAFFFGAQSKKGEVK